MLGSRGLGALCGEGNVPDASFGAGGNHVDDVLVFGLGIGAEANRLILVEGCELLHDDEQLLLRERSFIDDHRAIGQDVDDFLALHAERISTFCGGGHRDIELGFISRPLPSDDEKGQQQEHDVDHRGHLKSGRFEFFFLKFHGVSGCRLSVAGGHGVFLGATVVRVGIVAIRG